VQCNVQKYTDSGGFLFIVICYSSQTMEDSYIHSNLQQYTDSGGFYLHCNLQQYTESGVLVSYL
jgi:hypothetical protein